VGGGGRENRWGMCSGTLPAGCAKSQGR